MNKFSNGKIYKIVSPNHAKVYYGSTTLTLKERFDIHKNQRNCTSQKIIDTGDAEILEIEPFPCTCKEELEDREAEFMENDWEGCVNEKVPGAVRRAGGLEKYMQAKRQTPEYKARKRAYEQTPEQKAYKKEYNQTEKCKAMKRAYMQKPEVKEKQKAYQQTEKYKACKKAYHQTPEYKAYSKKQIPCTICGSFVSRTHMARHHRTKTCQKHLKTELEKVMDGIITSIELMHS